MCWEHAEMLKHVNIYVLFPPKNYAAIKKTVEFLVSQKEGFIF